MSDSLVLPANSSWAFDPLSLDALPSAFAMPPQYAGEAEESRFYYSSLSHLPDASALESILAVRPAHNSLGLKAEADRQATAALLNKLEQEADPFADFGSFPVYDVPAPVPSAMAGTSSATRTSAQPLPEEWLEGEEDDAVPHSPETNMPSLDGSYGYNSGRSPNSGSATPVRRRPAPYSKTKRRYPRSHTCREPERAEFATEEEYLSAWNTWRQIRNCNNEAVRRSRNCKKAMLGCKNESCSAMIKKLKAAEKMKELLLKAACAPQTMTRTESMAYNKLVAARTQYFLPGAPEIDTLSFAV